MKISTVFVINTIVTVFYGLGGLFITQTITGLYGIDGGDAFVFAVRTASAAFLGLGVMTFVARNAGSSKARDAMLLGLTVFAVVAAIVALLATLDGTMSSVGWSLVGIMAVLAVLFVVAGRSSMQTGSA